MNNSVTVTDAGAGPGGVSVGRFGGAAIALQTASSGTVTNSVFADNAARGPGGCQDIICALQGGAVTADVTVPSLSIHGSRFTGNSAKGVLGVQGGAVSSFAALTTVTQSSFEQNLASSTAASTFILSEIPSVVIVPSRSVIVVVGHSVRLAPFFVILPPSNRLYCR